MNHVTLLPGARTEETKANTKQKQAIQEQNNLS